MRAVLATPLVLLTLALAACSPGGATLKTSGTAAGTTGTSGQSDPNTAALIYPTDGATIDPFQQFAWTSVAGATEYSLYVGTSLGAQDIFSIEGMDSRVTSWWVDNLFPGVTYYARLWTLKGAWTYHDISFQAATQPIPTDRSLFYNSIAQATADVRLSADFVTNVPTSGSLLANEIALRGRSAAVCTDFAATLVELFQSSHIYARQVTLTQFGGLANGHSVAEYYDPFLNKWSVADATFGVIYFDDSTQTGQSAMELSTYVLNESWTMIHPKFVTTYGDMYMTHYYMDPITYYLNIVVQGQTAQQSLTHNPKQFLIPVTIDGAQSHASYVFLFTDPSQTTVVNNPEGPYSQSGSISVSPFDNLLWSNIFTLNDNWTVSSPPAGLSAYSFRRVMF
jgi:hypothetical protein